MEVLPKVSDRSAPGHQDRNSDQLAHHHLFDLDLGPRDSGYSRNAFGIYPERMISTPLILLCRMAATLALGFSLHRAHLLDIDSKASLLHAWRCA